MCFADRQGLNGYLATIKFNSFSELNINKAGYRIMNKPNFSLTSIISGNKKTLSKLSGKRLTAAKRSFVTRNVPLEEFHYLATGEIKPAAGDLVLARVDRLGQHQRLELPTGRRAHLFPGDEIIVSYGNRYAPDQFLGHVPAELGPCSLVAAGGIASEMVSKHARMKNATRITPLGFLTGHDKQIINLKNWQLPDATPSRNFPTVLAVVGSSMNGGKTTTASYIAHGLMKAGLSVGSAKITGTGAGGDFWKLKDSGAYPVIDFTDMGLATTYKVGLPQIESVMQRQINHLSNHGVDVILLEVADGLAQAETKALLEGKVFSSQVDGLFFAAAEALSVQTAVDWLLERGLPLLGVSGALTASPLILEETRQLCSVPVFSSDDLDNANFHEHLIKLMSSQDLSVSNFR